MVESGVTYYFIAMSQYWIMPAFQACRANLPGSWALVTDASDLKRLASIASPRYVFFPHWSNLVSDRMLEQTECVCFHMTDVPYGRGGSPLQNLIVRGHTQTVISALRMERELDAGPVYLKRPLSLEGAAHEIFARAANIIMDMIAEIVATEPRPIPQAGQVVTFSRRQPEQSLLPQGDDPKKLYDHIRMLDAPGYPLAFLDHGPWRARFCDARLDGAAVEARVRFEKKEENK